MKKVRLLDAFAGIGGFHLGVKQACDELGIDFECVGAIEFDKHARETYEANFPNVEMFNQWNGDITKIPLDKIPPHDILTGGFPCQPFSMAGKAYKNNMTVVDSDGRSTLFQNLINILKAKQPKYFIFENVKGILNLKNNDGELVVDVIKRSINDAGYNVIVKIISAHEVGIPQKRERVFFIGVLKPKTIVDFSFLTKDVVLNNFLDNNIDPSYYLHNIAVWQTCGVIRNTEKRIDMMYQSFDQRKRKGLHKRDYNNTVLAAEINGDTPSGRSRQTNRAYHNCGLSPTLTTVDKRIVYDGQFRYLTEREYARLQGFPSDFKLHSKKAYFQFGNAVCVDVVKNICCNLLKEIK
jgi:DNA (cytosine-5)-methyltransferase 1